VIDAATQKTLTDIIRRESRSLLQYVGEMFPWTTEQRQEAVGKLRQMVQEDYAAIAALSRSLAKRRVTPPFPGAYPMSYTGLGFVALDHVAPRLLEEQRRAVATLEAEVAVMKDADARAEVDKLLAVKRRHLPLLEQIAAAKPVSTLR
jgi:hypothetical protein